MRKKHYELSKRYALLQILQTKQLWELQGLVGPYGAEPSPEGLMGRPKDSWKRIGCNPRPYSTIGHKTGVCCSGAFW